MLFNRKEIRELKDDVIGRERRLFENSVKMEKIAQENAVLSKDLETLIRVAAMIASKLRIFTRLQLLIFTPILPVNPSTKDIDNNVLQYCSGTVYIFNVHLCLTIGKN